MIPEGRYHGCHGGTVGHFGPGGKTPEEKGAAKGQMSMKESIPDRQKKGRAVEKSARRIKAAEYHRALTPRDIENGVAAFVDLNNMQGGSAGDVDLFRLLKKYLLDLDARREINTLIHRAMYKER